MLTLTAEFTCFDGKVGFYRHPSTACNAEMKFSIFQPAQSKRHALPVLYFLAGLTCTEETFMIKAGAQRFAAEAGLILVAPDTSPRNTGIPGEDTDWDFGSGAGFYVDATQDPWRSHYQMYRYVTEELPELINAHFPVQLERQGICGHSMGGHGALICALKRPDRYRSVSAFAPIAAPMQCPWGQKAFTHYLGSDRELWRAHDATELVRQSPSDHRILIDQGMSDKFLETQLLPERFEQACAEVGQSLTLRRHPGYDHSYYFIASFMRDHIQHHAAALGQS